MNALCMFYIISNREGAILKIQRGVELEWMCLCTYMLCISLNINIVQDNFFKILKYLVLSDVTGRS